MHRSISGNVHIVNPSDNTDAVKSVCHTGDFKNTSEKVDKVHRLMKAGVMDGNLIKYLPSMVELVFQGLVYGIKIEKYLQIQPIRTFKIWNLI